jgi:arylsulfatase
MPKKKRGTTDDSFTLNVDLAATILGAAGLDAPKTMHGRDISHLYLENPKSTEPWRDEFYYEFPNIKGKIPPSIALVRKDWKYIYWTGHSYEELFNLKDDPFELKDLAKDPEHASLKQEMKKRLAVVRHEVFWPHVPGTRCDSLWPPRTDVSTKPNCSSDIPEICCP